MRPQKKKNYKTKFQRLKKFEKEVNKIKNPEIEKQKK